MLLLLVISKFSNPFTSLNVFFGDFMFMIVLRIRLSVAASTPSEKSAHLAFLKLNLQCSGTVIKSNLTDFITFE